MRRFKDLPSRFDRLMEMCAICKEIREIVSDRLFILRRLDKEAPEIKILSKIENLLHQAEESGDNIQSL